MMITQGTTRGGGQLARIYDRLRKRSQRILADGKVPYNTMAQPPRFLKGNSEWQAFDHGAYVAGVRDALNAVEHDAAAHDLTYWSHQLPA